MPRYRCLTLGLLAVILASSSWLAAQPPRKEEEEEPKGKEKARPVVPVPVAEPEKKEGPQANPEGVDADIGSFKEEAAKATNATARDFFRFLIVPYDRITANFKGGASYRIELLTLRELPEGELEVKVLDPTSRKTQDKKFATGTGFTYTPYELIVLEQVEKFLDGKTTMDRLDQLNYAARAVAAGLRWHLLAVTNNKRVGKEWEPVAKQLRDRHLALLRERFQALVDAKMYKNADEVGLKMLARYPDNNDVLRDVYGLQLRSTKEALKTPSDDQLGEASRVSAPLRTPAGQEAGRAHHRYAEDAQGSGHRTRCRGEGSRLQKNDCGRTGQAANRGTARSGTARHRRRTHQTSWQGALRRRCQTAGEDVAGNR